jgi:hypothetical protein
LPQTTVAAGFSLRGFQFGNDYDSNLAQAKACGYKTLRRFSSMG